MSNPAWSSMSDPPALLLRSYGASGKNMVLRSEMDAGYAKVRQRFTAAHKPVTGMVIVNESQYSELLAFLDVACAGGALPFDWTDPHTAGDIELRYIPPWQETPLGAGLWDIQLNLEILP